MAETVNSDLIIYDTLVQTAYLERLQDETAKFGAASSNSLVFRVESIPGDYKRSAFYKIGGAIAHRNTNSTAVVTTTNIDADEMVSVKCPWKYGPYAATKESFKRRARSPEEFSMLVGQDLADAAMAGWLDNIIASLYGAISGNAGMVVTGQTLAVHGKKVLTSGMRAFGDKFNRVAALVMDASLFLDFVDHALDNKLYGEIGTVIYGGQPGTMGLPVVVTDRCPTGLIFGLQPGAAVITESQAPETITYPINDKENIAVGYRAEGVFNTEVMGYSWEPEIGGKNPNKTALETSANWSKHATSDKATAGFIIDLRTGS